MSYTFHQENQSWLGDADAKSKPEVAGEEITDPTAMSGTLDTSGTTGTTETAEDVSPIFEVADEQAAQNADSEGELHRADPEYASDAKASIEAAGRTAEENEAVAEENKAEAAEEAEEDKFDGRKDPGEYTVPQVKAYLANATDEQKKKVQAKEAKGQNRAGIMNA